ncbi:MAG: DUF362 domain-containing protein [Methanomassiliicoccales archaeon]|nr:DUF362 domain-containing protein [Methanomassiliicoccales archaeon]
MPDAKQVAIVGCGSYEREEVLRAVERAIGLLGGLERFVSKGQRILVKPNLLQGAAPKKCVTTHPEVLYAVAKLLRDFGCDVVIADSPGGGTLYTEGALHKAYSQSGWDKVAMELGVELNLGTGYREVPDHEGRVLKRFFIINPALEADAIVSVPKAKTHVLTTMTGAAKNLFGVIPSLEKPALHSRFPRATDFSEMILDLNELLRPRLQVMDAVMGMEGDGPNSGQPRRIGAILASGDYTALDSVAARLMNLNPMEVGTIAAAAGRGLVRPDLADVQPVGDPLERYVIKDFKRPRTLSREKGFAQKRLTSTAASLAKAYSLKPIINRGKCTGCGKCVRICPKKTITMSKGKARIDSGRCIRCYCCHESCDSRAIELRRSMAGRAITRMVERRLGDGSE